MKKFLILIGLFVLTACGNNESATDDKTPPIAPKGLIAVVAGGQITLQWQANTESDLDKYLLFWGVEGAALSNEVSVIAPDTSYTLTGLTNGVYSFTLEAVDKSGNKSPRGVVVSAVLPGLPTASGEITSVKIRDYDDSLQVSQGSSFTLEIHGKGLATATNAKLGEVNGNVLEKNDTFVLSSFKLAANTPMGAKTLTFTLDDGVVSKDNSITVTALTFSPNGDDTLGKGTPDKPYRNLAGRAFGNGITVKLLDGTYQLARRIYIGGNVTIEGSSRENTIIQGAGVVDGKCFYYEGGVAGGTLSNLTLTGCYEAIIYDGRNQQTTAALSIHNVVAKDSESVALAITSAKGLKVNVTNSTFESSQKDGVYIGNSEDLELTLTKSSVNLNGSSGLGIDNTVKNINLTLTDSTASGNKVNGLFFLGGGTVVLNNSTFSGNNFDGVALYPAFATTASLDKVTVTNTRRAGIVVAFQTTDFKMFNSRIANNGNADPEKISGLLIYQTNLSSINLGDRTKPGGNTLTGNAACQIGDFRTSVSSTTITAYGNTIDSNPKGLKTGPRTAAPGLDFCFSAANTIDFGNWQRSYRN